MMILTPHFTLEELYQSSTALRFGINNHPSPEIIGHLLVAAKGMEEVRALLGGYAISVDSGYRCPSLNAAVKGSANSAHMDGYAVDFTCRAFGNPEAIVDAIQRSNIKLDQCICEGTWVHISFDPKMRQRFIRALFDQNGKPTYRDWR